MSAFEVIPASDFVRGHQGDKELQIIDVRLSAEFRQQRLKGSVSWPLDQLQGCAQQQWLSDQGFCEDEPLYVICQRGQRSRVAIEALEKQVNHPLLLVEGGIDACPVEWIETVGDGVISLERQVRIAAGFLVVIGVVCGAVLHSGFYSVPAVVGAGLMFAGITDTCGMGLLLARMPWNR